MASRSIGLLSASMILTLLTVALNILEATDQCHCQNDTYCLNGCNCYEAQSYGDICDGGYTYKCNGTKIEHVPDIFPERNVSNKLCVFELSNTRTRKLHKLNMGDNLLDVRFVVLTENQISVIDSNSFHGLENVVVLNLTSNKITHKSFRTGIFIALKKLQTISLKNNLFTTFQGLDIHLRHLTNLHRLDIDGCRGCELGPGLMKLTKLQFLSFSGRESNSCNLGNMSATLFKHVPSITHLYVSKCHLDRHINNLTFAPLTNIRLLDMSYNDNLTFEGMNRCLYGLKGSTTLYELNVNHIHESYERGTILKVEHVENLKSMKNLTVLHMDLNKLEVLELSILLNRMIPASVRNVTLTGNRLTYGKYFDHMFMLDHITLLDISRQHLKYDPFFHSHFDYDDRSTSNTESNQHRIYNKEGVSIQNIHTNQPQIYSKDDRDGNTIIYDCEKRKDIFIVPKDLQVWKWRKSFLFFKVPKVIMVHVLNYTQYSLTCVKGSHHLRYLDFSYNLIYSWQGPVIGVSNITHLDLSENDCKNVSSYFFDYFTGLKLLNISGNFLGHVIHPSNNESRGIFKHLSKLETLDISVNKISKLDKRIFQNLTQLHYLNLADNMMDEWTTSLENSPCIRMIDLSFNKFTTIPQTLRTYLDRIDRSHVSGCNYTGNITLNMAGNPIDCTCDSIPLMKWIFTKCTSSVNVLFSGEDKCTLPGGENRYLKDDVSEILEILKHGCVSYSTFITIWLVIVTCCSTIGVCFAVYKHRWRLRHWYYSKSRRHRHTGFERLFENDAFISYSKDDSSFIKYNLVPALEQIHNLKVWVADRDSYAGASIAENVTHAIYSSRKSVLLISRKYLRENWCDYEMNMARFESVESKRKLMVFVLYEDIPTKEIPLDILRLLKSEVSLEYPKQPQHLEAFWSSLAETIVNE